MKKLGLTFCFLMLVVSALFGNEMTNDSFYESYLSIDLINHQDYSLNHEDISLKHDEIRDELIGQGTIQNPYQISNLDDLLTFSTNDDYWVQNVYIKQMEDIDATPTQYWNEGAGFSPIGRHDRRFRGHFDGDGHIISNLFINRPDSDYIGFFGYTHAATIRNVSIENANFIGNYVVGGISGAFVSSTINNCYTNVSIHGFQGVSTFIGVSHSSVIRNCYAKGEVEASHHIGGLVGYLYSYSQIENSFSVSVLDGISYVGGLVGFKEDSTVTNSFWDIDSSNQAESDGGSGQSTSEMKTLSTYLNAGWDFIDETDNGTEDIWTFILNEYPHLSWEDIESVLPIPGNLQDTSLNGSINLTWSPPQQESRSNRALQGYNVYRNNGQINESLVVDTLFYDTDLVHGETYTYYVTAVYDEGESNASNEVEVEAIYLFLSGDGTQSAPYLVNNLFDLFVLSQNTDYWGQDVYIEQTGDIDAEVNPYVDSAGFRPIGYEWSNIFKGHYNGNDYTISNLYINRPDEEYVGLFGYIYSATISNLNLIEVEIYGNEKVGGLVGRTYANSLIENCSVSGVITGNQESNTLVGGLVGNNYDSTINNCASSALILSGTYVVGGLVGNNYNGIITGSYTESDIDCDGVFVGGLVGYSQQESLIEDSYALGNIQGNLNVGGLLGNNNNATINRCYSEGQVISEGNYAGGLVGRNNNNAILTNSFSLSSVNGGENYSGGLAGSNNAVINNCYAKGSVTGNGAYVGGLIGLTSESGLVDDCYSLGQVTGSNSVGALIGFNNQSTISNSFWNIDNSGELLGAGGSSGILNNVVGKTTTELKTLTTFTQSGWDFVGETSNGNDDNWVFNTGHYPNLAWEDLFVPEFTVSQEMISANTEVTFTNLSLGDITNYEWYFGDGSYSNEENPAHNYLNPGTYNVSLTIYEGDESLTETKFDFITVYVNSPSGLTAYVEDNENDVILNWQEQDGIWIQKCDDTNYNGIGFSVAAEFSVAIKYTQEELRAYQGMYLNSIKFFPRVADATYTLKIWGGNSGMEELYSQEVLEFNNMEWNEYQLDSTVPIPSSGDFYIGYRVDTPEGLPAGADSGPVVDGGNMIRMDDSNEWEYLHTLNSSLTVNFNIKGFVSSSGSERIVRNYQPQLELLSKSDNRKLALLAEYSQPTSSSTDYSTNTRDLTGYKVYRDDSMIAMVEPEVTTYVDYSLPNGTYEYYVTQVYGSVDSDPSNRVNVTIDIIEADFAVSDTTIYLGQSIDFINQSSGNVTNYLWDFGDGNTSDEENPSYTYQETGLFLVSLTISNENNSLSDTLTVKVYPTDIEVSPEEFNIQMDFMTNVDTTLILNNTSQIALNYNISFDNIIEQRGFYQENNVLRSAISHEDNVEAQVLIPPKLGKRSIESRSEHLLLFNDFENSLENWTTETYSGSDLWHISDLSSYSGNQSLWCGVEGSPSYDNGERVNTAIITPIIDINEYHSNCYLDLWEVFDTESGWDYCMIDISNDNGESWTHLRGDTNGSAPNGSSGGWTNTLIDLTDYIGNQVKLRFYFDTIDNYANNYSGWFIDDVKIYADLQYLTIDVLDGSLMPNEEKLIELQFNGESIVDNVLGTIFVNEQNLQYILAEVPYSLNINGAVIEISQNMLDFGSQEVNSYSQQSVTIINSGNALLELNFDNTDLAPFGINNENVTVNPSDSLEVEIYYEPEDYGAHNRVLNIETNDYLSPQAQVNLQGFVFPIPQNITSEIDNEQVTLMWDEVGPVSGLNLLGYNVYKDSTLINSEPIEDNYYLDTDNNYGEIHNYYITTSYEEGESYPSENLEVNFNEIIVGFVVSDSLIYLGNSITFNNLSQGPVDDYLWDFGDGNTSEDENPVHLYSESGLFTVILTISNESYSVSDSLQIEVLEFPVIVVDQNSLNETLEMGQTSNQSIQIENQGTIPLDWTLNIDNISGRRDNNISEIIANNPPSLELAKGEVDQRIGYAVTRGSGGPDNYGYSWIDSNEAGGPNFEWNDISTIGSATSLSGDDSYISLTLPFNFKFYGNDYESINVSTNGFISFSALTSSGLYSNDPIPTTSMPNNMIAAFWDDLHQVSGQSYYYHDQSGIYDKIVFQYSNWGRYNGTNENYNFQIHLVENGDIYFYYSTMYGTLTSGTVGLENSDASDYLPIAFNTSFIEENMCVKISPAPQWIVPDVYSGTILPNENQEIDFTFSSEDLFGGLYEAEINILSNDPYTPLYTVNANLEVVDFYANFEVAETIIDEDSQITFTNLSLGTITSYLWDFGDGGSSTEQNPTYVYETPGLYTISLTISNPNNSDTEIKYDYITVNNINYNPVITLPDSFTFAEDTTLEVDFSAYITDVDEDDDLILSSDLGEYVYTEIDGFSVIFSAMPDWYGSEVLYFTVDDQAGEGIARVNVGRSRAIATDSVQVIVTPVDDPMFIQNQIDDIYEPMNSPEITIALADRFADIDSEITSYAITFNTFEELVSTSQSDSILTLTFSEDMFGTAEIELTAYNNHSDQASMSFNVDIWPTPEMGVSPEAFTVSVLTGESFPSTLTIENDGLGALEWGLESVNYQETGLPEWVEIATSSGNVEVDGEQVIEITFSGLALSAGEYHAQIIFSHNNPNQDLIEVPVTFTVLGLPEISVSTTSLNFGNVFVNSSQALPLVISNSGTSPLTINNISATGNYFSINYQNFTIPVGQSRTIEITFSPEAVGNDDASLNINSNDYLHNPLLVSLFAEAINPPEIEVVGQDLEFYVLGSGVDTETILIRNNGASTLEYNLESDDSWLNFNPFMGQLEPAGQQEVTITVNPANLVAGIYNSSLSVNSNVPGSQATIVDFQLVREVYNVTDFDNENNNGDGIADNDLDVLVGYNSANAPIEFNIYSNNPNPETARLSVRAWNVDNAGGGAHNVYLNGYFLGELRGLSDAWTTTLFEVQPAYLSGSLVNSVEIDVDSDFVGNSIKVDWGQLSYDNTSLNASIRYIDLDQSSYYAGSSVGVTEEIDTNLSSQEVRVETSIYSPWGTIVTGTSRLLTIIANQSDAFTESLEIADHYTPGVYELQVIVYDNNSNVQQDLFTSDFEVKPYESEILVETNSIDFGPVLENETSQEVLTITNTGHADLVITEISSNQANFTSNISTTTIAYNDSQEIIISFTPTSLGQVEAILTIMSNAANAPALNLDLSGTGIANVPYIEVSHTSLEFGNVYTIVPESQAITIRNVGPAPLEITNITSDNIYFVVSDDQAGTVISTNEELVVYVTFEPVAVQEYTGNITISSNADNQANFIIPVSGQGSIAPQVTYTPNEYELAMSVGENVTQTLELGNTGGNDLTWNIKDNFGKMFEVDGFNSPTVDYGYIRNRAPIQLYGGSFSVELWFKVDSNLGQRSNGSIYNGGKQCIVSKSTASQTGSFGIYTDGIDNQVSDKNLKVALNNGSNREFLVANNIELHQWYHVAVSYSDNSMRVYLDGSLISQEEVANFSGNYDPWILGKMSQTGSNWYRFDGALDELRIWESARTQTQIANYRNVRLSGEEQNLGGYWNFDQEDLRDGSSYQTAGVIYGNASIIESSVSSIPSWIAFSTTSGQLGQGSQTSLDIDLDASNIIGGTYNQIIELSSNDPDEGNIEIPLTVNVSGIPNLVISPESLEFGNSFIGYSDTLSVLITNTGTDVLSLSDFDIGGSIFTTDVTEVNIPAYESQRILINFSPLAETIYSGELSFTTNLPGNGVRSVELIGNGVYTPQIALSPSSFSATVNSGQVTSQELTVSNVQGEELSFDIEIIEVLGRDVVAGVFDNLPNSNKGMVWVDGYLYVVSYSQNKLVKYDINSESVIAQHTIHSSPFGITYDGVNLWIGSSSGLFYSYDLSGNLVNQFENTLLSTPALAWNGENFIITSSRNSNPQIYTVDVDGNVITTINTDFNGKMNQIVWVADHIGGELWALDYNSHKIRQLNPTNGDVLNQISYDDFTDDSYALTHNGRDLWIAPDEESDSKLYRIEDNIDEFNWLSVSPSSGSLLEGENQIVTLEYNARNLMAGLYDAVLDISSNDADTPQSSIFVALEVTGQAVIITSQDDMDFGTGFIGQTHTEELTVSNAGTSDLEISNITFNSVEFSVTESEYSIEPLASQTINLAFTPLSSGVKTGQMTIYSNDSSNSEYTIELTGIAEGEPTINVNPAALEANLTVDEEGSEVIRVTNNGGSNLSYSLALDESNARGESISNEYDLRELGLFADDSRNVIRRNLPFENLVASETNRFFGDQIATYPNMPANNSGLYWLNNELYIVDFNEQNEGQASGRLVKYDIETYQITASYPIHTQPYGITYDGTYFWIGNVNGNIFAYDPTELNNSSNIPIWTFTSPVDEYPTITYIGDSFLINQGFSDNPLTTIYRVAHNGDILESYSAYLGKHISQLVWVEEYYNNELWAIENINIDGTGSGKILQLSLVNGTIIVISEKDFWDNQPIYSLTSDGKDLWISDASGPLFQVDDGRWLSADNTSGSITPGNYQDINVTFDPTGIYGGDYNGNIRLTSNDPQNSLVSLPVAMRVQGYPEYEISANQLSFGEVAVGYSDTKSITISNTGSDDLEVESISFTPEGVFTSNSSLSALSPGESTDIPVVFTPNTNDEFSASMDIQTNIGLVSIELNGQGYLPPIIGLSLENISSSLNYGQEEETELVISNSGDRSLTYELLINGSSRADSHNGRSRSVNPADWLSISSTTGSIIAGDNETILVTLSATDVYAGSYSAMLLVNSNDPQGTQEIPVQLSVTGSPSITVSETSLDFGSVLIGNSSTETFTISNSGSSSLQVSSISIESDEFLVTPPSFTLAPEASRIVTVSFTPQSQGAKDANVIIISNDENGEEQIELTGYGMEASSEIYASTNTLEFSEVNVGNSKDIEYTLYNQGTGILRITDISSSHPDFVSLSTPSVNNPINIQPGSSRSLNVRFAPSGDDQETAVLAISSNAGNTALLEIAMSGSGLYVPQIAINRSSLDWFILDNTINYDEIVLSNEGQAELTYSLTAETIGLPWLTANPISGTIDVGASTTINLTVDTRNIDYGSYFADFVINSNDPDNLANSIPMILNHSNFNFTETDNAGNDFVETADNDLGININEGSPNAPVEFLIYTNETDVDFAKLRIRAYDIDFGEINYVFVNGTWVGQLVGSNNNYSITEFMISPALVNLGENVANEIEISLDVNSTDSGSSKIMWGQFVFNQPPIYASINSLGLNRSNYYPGEEVEVNSLLSTQLYSQSVRAEYELINADLEIIDTYQENFTLSIISSYQASATLDLPGDSNLGEYSIKMVIFDVETGVKQSERTTNLSVLSGNPVISTNSEINFGNNYIGYPKIRNIQVTNQGYSPLSIASITTSNGYFTVIDRAFVLQNGQSETITVTFESSEEGSFNEELWIESNDPDNSTKVISLSGNAIEPPHIELSTSEIATSIPRFGTDTAQFMITNSGNSPLNVSSISVSGTSWLNVDPPSLLLEPASSENVELSFTSYDLTEGNYNAIVQVNSDDPDNTTYLINITMTVTERLITANFTASPLSGPKELEVTFSNFSQTSDSSQITQYQWDFQDDGIVDSNEINPIFTYENRGTYSVRLTATNENNESHSLLRTDYVNVINTEPVLISPIPNIVMDEDTINQELDLRTYFTDADGDNLIFRVSGNNNIQASITNGIVTLIPNQDWQGIEELTLTATDSYQALASDVITVTVVDVPDAPQIMDLPESITILQTTYIVFDFANHVYDPEQSLSLLSLSIDNNEHITYDILGLEVTFYAPADWLGTETLTINVSDGTGRLVTSQDLDVYVTDSFVANFTADRTEILSGESVYFTDLTEGNPNHWVWYLDGDNVVDSYEQNPIRNYNIGGTYSVSLVVSYINDEDIVVASDSVRFEDYITSEGTSIPGGNYWGDWEAAMSPYNVYGEVSIETGEILTIEEGTFINFMDDTEIVVEGELIADGVTFGVPETETREVRQWQGIKFNPSTGNSSLTNSVIKNAKKAIEITGSSPNLSGLNIEGVDSEYPAIKIVGGSQATIDDLDIDKFNTGIEILGDSSADIPVITNIRVRHTTNTNRTEGDAIAVKIQNSNLSIDNLDIEDFGKAIEIKSTSGSTAPVLTNIRVRHTTNTSRDVDDYAIKVEGNTSPNISNTDIDDFSKAIIFEALNSSTAPVLTNIRVRHTTNTSRELADTGIEFIGGVSAEIDSLEIEDYITAISFVNDERAETTTPTLTNIRVRHTTNTSRPEAVALKSVGKVNLNLVGFESEDVKDGISFYSSESVTPTLTNIRVRHTTNTSRDLGGKALDFVGDVSPELSDVIVEDYVTGINFDNSSRSEETIPVLTNIRVRHTTNTSRTNAVALKTLGSVKLVLDDFESDNVKDGIAIYSSGNSAPVLTNIRVRHTTNTSRDLGGTGIYLVGSAEALLDSVLVEDCITGISLENLSRTESSQPVLTNIRVRHTTNTSRIEAIALKSVGFIDLKLTDFESENVMSGINLNSSDETIPVLTNIRVRHTTNTSREIGVGIALTDQVNVNLQEALIEGFATGLKITGNNQANIERNTIIDNLIAIDLSGVECLPQIHHNHIENNLEGLVTCFAVENINDIQILNNNILGFSRVVSGQNSSPYFSQNIIWGAPIPEDNLSTGEQMNASFEYNNISMASGNAPGLANMNTDPLFTDTDGHDLILSVHSQCIDGGNPNLPLDPDESVADIGMNYVHHLGKFDSENRFSTLGSPIRFQNLSEGHEDESTTIHWNFGDGNTSNELSPEHIYGQIGMYTVTLTMETGSYTDIMEGQIFVVIQEEAILPPQNPSVTMTGSSLNLSWEQVTESVNGNQVNEVTYIIYSCEDPEGIFRYRADVTSLNWTDVNIAQQEERQFYFILSFVGNNRSDLQEFIRTHRYLRRNGQVVNPNLSTKPKILINK